MRKTVYGVIAPAVAGLGIVILSMGSASAEVSGYGSTDGLTCDGYATTVADAANKDIMQRATALDTNKPGKVLMIAAGRKFYMPARQVDQDTLAPISAYERMSAWNTAYREAKWQCLHARNITIEVKK